MRRWIVERRLVPAAPEPLRALLARRLVPARLPLPGLATGAGLDVRIHVEPASAVSAWLILTGAYPPPRDAFGAPVDVSASRRVAREQGAALLDALVREFSAAAAPLPGITPIGAPEPAEPLVADVMEADGVAIDEDLDLDAAASLLASAGADGAPVVSANGRLLGVLTERDLLAALLRVPEPPADGPVPATAGELCSRPALITVPQLAARRAAQQMLYHGVRRLAVVEDGRLVGMVTRAALYAALRAHATRPAAESSSR